MNGLSQWMQSPEVIRKKSCSWCWTKFKFPHIDPSAGHLRAYLTFIIRLLFSILLLRTYCTDTSRTSEDTSIIIYRWRYKRHCSEHYIWNRLWCRDAKKILKILNITIYGMNRISPWRRYRHENTDWSVMAARNFWNVTGCVPPNQLLRIFPAVETHRYCTND